MLFYISSKYYVNSQNNTPQKKYLQAHASDNIDMGQWKH